MDNTTTTATANLTDGMHMLTEALMANGVTKMYGVVGIPVTDFARIAQAKGIRYIGMRHEADAGNAAAAEGFITGKPGIFLTVSAPGFLNGITPLKEATENGWPCIMIGGSSTRHLVDMGEGDYEGLDQLNFAKPFCKVSMTWKIFRWPWPAPCASRFLDAPAACTSTSPARPWALPWTPTRRSRSSTR